MAAHLNAKFQRIARRDKKALLSDQCKEIKTNNRMAKTRDFFKKMRDIKGLGSIPGSGTPVSLPGESHGWRSLVGYSPWGSQRVGHD